MTLNAKRKRLSDDEKHAHQMDMVNMIADLNLPLVAASKMAPYMKKVWERAGGDASQFEMIPVSAKTLKTKMQAMKDKNMEKFRRIASKLSDIGKWDSSSQDNL